LLAFIVRIVLLLSFMKTSTTARVREQLAALPVDTFVWSRDLNGPTAAIETALSRILAEDQPPVVRVRKGFVLANDMDMVRAKPSARAADRDENCWG
jgi:hypothetical protein